MTNTQFGTALWPTEIRLRPGGRSLFIAFEDGSSFELEAEYLRVESPSAEVQGHHPAEKLLVSGKAEVAIVAVEPVGHYAVRLRFDDGHDSGIYSWRYLAELGRGRSAFWARYASQLAKAGLARDP